MLSAIPETEKLRDSSTEKQSILLSVIVTKAIKQALTIVDRIDNGELPTEARTITELVSKSTGGAEGSILNIAALVVGACWLVGIIDSYRLGIIQEK